MKIKKLTTHIVHVDLSSDEQFAYSQYWFDSRRYLIVEVESADGTVGVGEAFGPPEVTAAVVESVYAPLLLGRDPLDRDNLWLEMYNKLRDHGRKGVGIEALSALDIALCDLAGKEFGVPVYRLFGRHYRDSVQAYATGLYRRRSVDNTAALVREARQYVDQGFKAMKSKIGFGLQYDREVVTAIREAIGPDVLLAADVNHGYETSQALAACKFLEPLDIAWLEEPVVPEHLAGYRHLRRHTTIPIAGGEAEFTRYGFRELLSTGAVDIAQPDCCAAGGLSEAVKIADMADAWQVRCMPHVWGTAVALATALQFLAMIAPCPPAIVPTEPMLELDRSPNLFREELNRNGYELSDGFVTIPDRPGLGVELDRAILQKYGQAR